MTLPVPEKISILQRLWKLGCSLKLAIALATAATLLIMVGSLVMHFNPAVFGDMEEEILGHWLPRAWAEAPLLVAWLPLSILCVLLFAVNTLCCLIDWLFKIAARWRKTGEYLIHAGFILLAVAWFWGSTTGFRSGPHRIFPGERLAISEFPGYSLELKEFTPRMAPSGMPLDMLNRVVLQRNGAPVAEALVRINHPLLHDGLVILPTSFGQGLKGFRFHIPGRGVVELGAGSRLELSSGTTLVVDALLPDVRRNGRGQVVQGGDRLGNPAMELTLLGSGGQLWHGWYFLRQQLPDPLQATGLVMRPLEPVYGFYSLLTINRDPGDRLALAGAVLITLGVLLAFFSFYRKRALGDRPEV